jgi:hypothetical protein
MPATPIGSTPPLYTTRNRYLAAFLIATGRVQYHATRGFRRNSVDIVLEDPESLAALLARDYSARSAAPVDPRTLFDAYQFLADEFKRAQRAAEFGNVEPIPVR